MKNRILTIIIISLLSFCATSAQSKPDKTSPLGRWKYEAPYAPEGYTSGTIEITLADNKYSSSITFSGSDYKVTGEQTKVQNDSVTFIIYVEGDEVSISLKAENETKMTGKAVYSEGEIPLSLTKENSKK